jgi:glycosyltransferase involved in cell wall biosynthesis
MTLAIAIPTFNRPTQLANQLHDLDQIALAHGPIQVVIGDNSETISGIAFSKYTNLTITYNHNKRNVGLSGNIAWILSKVTEDYVWILGDDDKINPNRVSHLVNQVITQNCDFYILSDKSGDSSEIEFKDYWMDSAFLSTCIFGTRQFRNILAGIDALNDTYPQMLLIIAGYIEGLKGQPLKNEYVFDVSNPKRYLPVIAQKVQIVDLMELERFMGSKSLESAILKAMGERINSNIISYSIQSSFNYHKRQDFRNYFTNWCFKLSKNSKRNKCLLFANLILILSLLNYRISRLFLLGLFRYNPDLNSTGLEENFFEKRSIKLGSDASSIGYSPEPTNY